MQLLSNLIQLSVHSGGEQSGPLLSFNTQLGVVRAVESISFHSSTTPHIWPQKIGKHGRKKDIKQTDLLYFNPQFQATETEFVHETQFILPLLLLKGNENMLRHKATWNTWDKFTELSSAALVVSI